MIRIERRLSFLAFGCSSSIDIAYRYAFLNPYCSLAGSMHLWLSSLTKSASYLHQSSDKPVRMVHVVSRVVSGHRST